jgi:hypothetical protein
MHVYPAILGFLAPQTLSILHAVCSISPDPTLYGGGAVGNTMGNPNNTHIHTYGFGFGF